MKHAPEFTLENTEGEQISLPNNGKVVLYFYPQAGTPGCTLEGKTFTQLYPEFIAENTLIIGVSPDEVEAVKNFKEEYEFPFTLLADPDHAVAEAYEVWGTKEADGKQYEGIHRTTFLIENGEILNKWQHKPGETEQKVLDAVKGNN